MFLSTGNARPFHEGLVPIMIVTDRFVFLAFPRTGTTFVRGALRELYRRTEPGVLARLGARRNPSPGRLRELILPITDTVMAERAGRTSQHGGYRQIPPEARHLPVFSVARDPLDQVVSAYEHRFWHANPIWDVAELSERYPGYPDLRFEQFVEMMLDYGVRNLLKGRDLRADAGFLTLRFLRFYTADPERVLDALTDDYIANGQLSREIAPVRFVHLENLVPELRGFLAEMGFPAATTEFMLHLPRVNAAAARRGSGWSEYYTPELRERVRHAERLLFRVFPEYDR